MKLLEIGPFAIVFLIEFVANKLNSNGGAKMEKKFLTD